MPATEYGKYLKKLRIDKDKTLAAMATTAVKRRQRVNSTRSSGAGSPAW